MTARSTGSKTGSANRRNLDAGALRPMADSFELHLRAERKSEKTIRTYTEAALWFAAEYLLPNGLADWSDAGRGRCRSGP